MSTISPLPVATLRTPYRDATTALAAFLVIRKAEGASPCTLESYLCTVRPFLEEHPDSLERPREALLSFVVAPDNDWTRFTRLKVLKVYCSFLVEEGLLDHSPSEEDQGTHALPADLGDPLRVDRDSFRDILDVRTLVGIDVRGWFTPP